MRRAIVLLILVAFLPACAKRAGGFTPREPHTAEESAARVEQDSQSAAARVPEFGRAPSSELEKALGVILIIAVSLAAAAGLAYLSYVVIPNWIN